MARGKLSPQGGGKMIDKQKKADASRRPGEEDPNDAMDAFPTAKMEYDDSRAT